ncbi:tetratricopeptide repeat protein [Actinospica sp. MGRD01-02]|uniref:Tetratricopeptide repeat protein n=1 Tax=Actinospica acidithermotolerans TaxID=2828514 RepID=A0A941EA90_9ACTN|nr:BTAD domain-containing putative transcriptional regulator [Actinospica acidithermotolerans]MBR7829100.1 tetratricopeptide repeat protein [Actinospica acidithermotolerans]
MRYSLLGPLRVWSDGTEIPIRGRLRRALLAALVLDHDTVVHADRLVQLLWGDKADSGAPLHNQLMRLRQALGDSALIRAVPPGYLLHVAPADLDLAAFTDHFVQANEAAASAEWLSARKLYAAALDLWRGEMLVDVPALHSHPAIQRYAEDRLVALQGRIEADLNLGRHAEIIDELKVLTVSNPLREALHAQLMLALYRAGRRTDALDVYRDLRRTTIAELGGEPGTAIQALRRNIFNASPSLAVPPSLNTSTSVGTGTPRSALPTPRQLPADTRLFTGRHSELDELTSRATDGSGAQPSGTVVISAINGMGGVGKTALAIRAAHRMRDCYPDGQLFIDLHGYAADLDPIAPEDALDYLLRSLGVPPQAIPGDVEARTALYRSKLAGTRTLIVLDNAVNAAQVRPLLPAAPGCLVLVTSRNRLTSLDGAHLLALDVLSHDDAAALLREVAGPARAADLAARADAAAELATLCAHTPLALRIVAARLRHDSTLTVETLTAELAEEANRLAGLQDDDRDLTTVFNASLRILPEFAQQLFRLLGLVPGPDFDLYAAAHLAATDLSTAEHHLSTLLDHNLLIQHTPGRYRLHDLLRAHARTLAAEDPAVSTGAFDRLVDYYLAVACAADGPAPRLLAQRVSKVIKPFPDLAELSSARLWRRTEHANLLALIAHPSTGTHRRDTLIDALSEFHRSEGPWSTAAELLTILLASARDRSDRAEEVRILCELSVAICGLGEAETALDHLGRALAIVRELGDRRAEADVLSSIGATHFQRGDNHLAVEPYEQASAIYREVGPPVLLAGVVFRLAILAHCEGRNASAREHFAQAADLYRAAGSKDGEANTLLTSSRAAYALEDFGAVRPMLDRGLELTRQTANKISTANVLQEIGRQQLLTGDFEAAADKLDEALTLHLEIGFRLGEANIYFERGRIAAAQGHVDVAEGWLTRSLDLSLEIRNAFGEAQARNELAKLLCAAGELDLVAPHLDRALQINLEAQYLVGEAEVRNTIAAYRAASNGAEAGLALYRDALDLAVRAEHPLEKARALEGMARCEVRLGMLESGVEHLRAAVDLYGRMKVVEYEPAAAWLEELAGAGGIG